MKKTIKHIADGDAGIDQTVSEMWRLINKDAKTSIVRQKAAELKGSSDSQTAKNIYEWVWRNVPYKSDPAWAEQLTAPRHLLSGEKIGEDCDGLVMLVVSLLLSAGIPARVKTIAWRRPEFTHVVAEAKINGTWTILDPTLKAAGYGSTHKIIREKNYGNPMGELITLDDGAPCCNGGNRKKRSRNSDPVNQNIIVLGNDINENSRNWDYTDFDHLDMDSRRSRPQIERITKEVPVEKKVIEKEFVPYVKEKIIPIPQRALVKNAVSYGPEFY